jgi:hypothetical protein
VRVHCRKIAVSRKVFTRWSLTLLLCLVSVAVLAEEPAATQPGADTINTDCTDLFPNDPLSKPPTDIFSFLDYPQHTLYTDLESIARSLDSFFANETVRYDYSGTYARYTLDTSFAEGGETSVIGNLNVSLRLPRTQQKLSLVLESDPLETQSPLQRATTVGTEQSSNNGVFAGLQKEFGKEEKWRFKPSLGLKLHFPIEYYVRMRAYRDYKFELWNMLLSESIYWYDTTGTGIDSEMTWSHVLDDDLLFSASSLVRYTTQYDRFDLSEVFALTQPLSRRRTITYSIGFFGNTDPTMHITDYVLQARYRQLLHSNYLYMELVPQVRYSIDHAFTQEDSFLLRLEWFFQH